MIKRKYQRKWISGVGWKKTNHLIPDHFPWLKQTSGTITLVGLALTKR